MKEEQMETHELRNQILDALRKAEDYRKHGKPLLAARFVARAQSLQDTLSRENLRQAGTFLQHHIHHATS